MQAETGKSSIFSLGGTFAVIFAALQPKGIERLTLVGTPLNYGPQVGQLKPLVHAV